MAKNSFSHDEKLGAVDTLEQGKESQYQDGVIVLSQEEIEMEKRIVRKIDKRLLPTTAIIYLLCYLDRSNIGNAKILNASTGDDLLTTNHMSNYQYVIALMLFMVAYCIFEAPSNLALKVLSPRRWLAFLIIAFGAFCAGIGGTTNAAGVTALRFFLGAAEAGVFPGMIYYFSFWYKPEERASRIAAFLCSATLSGAFGGCLAYGIGHMNGVGGLEAWRWLFILEGVPSVVMGVFVWFWLPSYPEHVGWLSEEEKDLQQRRLGIHGNASEAKVSWKDATSTLMEPRLYGHYLAYFGIGAGVASLSLFSPSLVAGLGYKDLDAQLYTVPPYAAAYGVTMIAAWLSDHFKTRGIVAGSCCLCGGIAFAVLAALPTASFRARYGLLVIATSGVFGGLPSLCAWVGDNSRNTTGAALATALNIALSAPAQIIGVWIYRAQDKPLYKLGHAINAAMVLMTSICCFSLTFYYRRQNAKLVGTNEPRWMT